MGLNIHFGEPFNQKVKFNMRTEYENEKYKKELKTLFEVSFRQRDLSFVSLKLNGRVWEEFGCQLAGN